MCSRFDEYNASITSENVSILDNIVSHLGLGLGGGGSQYTTHMTIYEGIKACSFEFFELCIMTYATQILT